MRRHLHPRLSFWIIALVPVFPPLYLLAFYSLRYLRGWNRHAILVFVFYLAMQTLAALYTPYVALSILLALARGLFIIALLTTGAQLRKTRYLYPLLYGLSLVYLTALASSFLVYGLDVINLRLKHPYYTEVSLGLAGTVGILLVATWQEGKLWQRLAIGFLAFVVLALSGSRGALAALLVGTIGGVLAGYRRMFAPVFGGISLLGVSIIISNKAVAAKALQRFFSLSTTGRLRFWHDAWETFLAHPWGGVGPYQLGPYLKSLYWGQCQLWPILERKGIHCPTWLQPLTGAWIIAHNAFLHHLGEAGIIGTAGLLALLGFVAYSSLITKEPLIVAVLLGYLTMGLVDVPTAVPSLHLAEFYWVSMGIAAAKAGFYNPPQ